MTSGWSPPKLCAYPLSAESLIIRPATPLDPWDQGRPKRTGICGGPLLTSLPPDHVTPKSIAEQKQALRQQIRARRRAISPAERLDLEKAWLSQALNGLPWRPGQNIAAYVAQGSELNLQAFLGVALARGMKLFLPCVLGKSALAFCRYVGQAMAPSALGVLEPTGPTIPLAEVDTILLPLVAVDATGWRLGQGGGYYDRTLAEHAGARRVGVAFDQQCVDVLPVDAFDQPLDALITPSGVRIFTQNHRVTTPSQIPE